MAELEDIVREEYNNFLYKKGPQPTRLHLPEGKDLNRSKCQDTIGKEYDFVIKPVNAYPKGYRKVCENCMTEWKKNND